MKACGRKLTLASCSTGTISQLAGELFNSRTFTNRYIDLIEEGVDVAVRLGALQNSSLIARRLTQFQFRSSALPLFHSPGPAAAPEDVINHNCLLYAARDTGSVREWRFRRDGAEFALTPQGDMTISDSDAPSVAVRSGYGVAQIQDYYVDDAIVAGELEAVLAKFNPTSTPISLSADSASLAESAGLC